MLQYYIHIHISINMESERELSQGYNGEPSTILENFLSVWNDIKYRVNPQTYNLFLLELQLDEGDTHWKP